MNCMTVRWGKYIHRSLTLSLQVHLQAIPPQQILPDPQGGQENQAFSIPGKHSLVMNLQKTVAKRGSPDVIAPGKWSHVPMRGLPDWHEPQ